MLTPSELIRKRRDELNLTLEEVATRVGVTRATVSKWEHGDIANMRRDKIQALADVLELDPSSFIVGAEIEAKLPSESDAVDGLTLELSKKLKDLTTEELLELRGYIRGRFGK